MKNKKKKLLVFHPALAPYRIDLFNALNNEFEAKIIFFRENLRSQKFDREKINSQLNFQPEFLTTGFYYSTGKRMIRFGFVKKIFITRPDIILNSEYNITTFITLLFTKLFFPKTKSYTFCDDSVDVAQKSPKDRKIGRYLCLKLLDGVVLSNDFVKEWYNSNFTDVKTIVFPIIQKEERLKSYFGRFPFCCERIQKKI